MEWPADWKFVIAWARSCGNIFRGLGDAVPCALKYSYSLANELPIGTISRDGGKHPVFLSSKVQSAPSSKSSLIAEGLSVSQRSHFLGDKGNGAAGLIAFIFSHRVNVSRRRSIGKFCSLVVASDA